MTERPDVLLGGEQNPYGGNPSFALYPLPAHASGGRLARILNMTSDEYLAAFRRANLCDGDWKLAEARARADELLRTEKMLVLLGAKVCLAFRVTYMAFSVMRHDGGASVAILPHPSWRCTAWNVAGNDARARGAIKTLREMR